MVQSKASVAHVTARWPPDDPGLASLRRALRVALIMTPAFAFTIFFLRDAQITTFVALGSFALMVMADFGGVRAPRAVAYSVTVLVGAVLVVIGTLVSPVPWAAAVAMFVVAFFVQFLGVFGSYAAAAQPALQLLFVLTVSIPAPPAAIGSRLLGWIIAGTVSTLAGVFLWPRFEQVKLQGSATDALRALAALLEAERRSGGDGVQEAKERAAQAVRGLREDYSRTAKRPAGPTRRDRAFVEMLTELERTLEFLDGPFGRQISARRTYRAEGDRLAVEVVRTLLASAAVMKGGDPPDLLSLEEARSAHRVALDRWTGESLSRGERPEDVLEELDADHALRVISYMALALGTNATVAAGRTPDAELQLPAGTPLEGPSRVFIRVARTLRTHLSPDSAVLHNALRSATGLALAVLLARLLQVDHAFWVVLGTASVLRTNALATGRTTLEALLGTLLGFAIGAAFTAVAGNNRVLLWIALPFVAFLAAYASTTVGFLVGQAAFTINVLILFNLITPVGWRLGLARIEDVAIGAGISVIIGLLLWPRGARRELSHSIAGFYRSVAIFVGTSYARVLDGASLQDSMRARMLAVLARDRAREALEQFLNERAAKRIAPEVAGSLLASGSHALMVGDNLNRFADMGYQGKGCSQGVEALEGQVDRTLEALKRLGDRLDRARVDGDTAGIGPNGSLREAALGCLRRWRKQPDSTRSAIAIVVAVEWTEQLAALTADLEQPVSELAKAARVPWWR
ncbi:MAG: FUSC family protein [Candidatus Dormibacteraeota bacterium]|nr:FUSC family protein [Candidatus Dormibacteraeota bacterium]